MRFGDKGMKWLEKVRAKVSEAKKRHHLPAEGSQKNPPPKPPEEPVKGDESP
jgi:hypothetical protein